MMLNSINKILNIGNGIIIAGSGNGGGKIYRSTDYGATWGTANDVIPSGFVASLVYCGNGIVILGGATLFGFIYRSTDYGQNFSLVLDGTTAGFIDVWSLAYLGNDIVIAGLGAGGASDILRSADNGLTWTTVGAIQVPNSSSDILCLTHCGGGVVVGGTGEAYLVRSLDYGLTWTSQGVQAGETSIYSIQYTEDRIILVGTSPNAKILRSTQWINKSEYITHGLATAINDFIIASGNGVFVKKTLAEVKAILGLELGSELIDGAAIAADCESEDEQMFDLDTAESAPTITLSNIKVHGKYDFSINKSISGDTTITLAGTGMVFEMFDSANNCYTLGTSVVLSGVANTMFGLNMIVSGLLDGSSNMRIRVTGTYASFS